MGAKISKNQEKKYCCIRFKEFVKDKLIYYAYENTNNLDETAWYIPDDFGHIYYCPFCGTHIKGEGWGEYDLTRKPDISVKMPENFNGMINE